MTLTELRNKADAKLVDFWQLLTTKQDAYHAKHGKYFQLLITDPVVDGVDTAWVLRTPSDEKHAIDVDFNFSSPVPFSISVDEWINGAQQGYSATATVELPNGDKYSRTRHNDNTDTGWNQVIEII